MIKINMLNPKWSGVCVWLPDILPWLEKRHVLVNYKNIISIMPIYGGITTIEITKEYVKIPLRVLIAK